MSERPRTGTQATDPRSAGRTVQELMNMMSGGLYIGHPSHPEDPTNTDLALGTAATHNGTIVHLQGSWVQWEIEEKIPQLGVQHEFIHNLNVPPINATTPNVCWVVLQKKFTGNVVAGSFTDVHYGNALNAGLGAVTADSIELVVSSNLPVGGGYGDLTVTLWFTPALR